jgi:hypothetical protein
MSEEAENIVESEVLLLLLLMEIGIRDVEGEEGGGRAKEEVLLIF